MNVFSRILLIIATLILPIVKFTPIWYIQLWAPQYPEGLEMQIWIDRLSGNIEIINGLNHYIGMANIEQSMFPELKYLTYILYGIITLGVLASVINRKWLLYLFTTVMIVLAIAAVVDMYAWGYRYGHNLDPHAAIKIEGESYQPPLIGYKQLLNFLALSMPDKGGIILFASTTLAAIASIYQMIRDRKVKKSRLVNQLPLSLLLLIIPSCQPGSDNLNYGVDDCAHCGMKLVDNKFGTVLITDKGKSFKFDDVNCMITFKTENKASSTFEKILITDFSRPGKLIDATKAYYLHSENIKSPMGSNTAAFLVKDSLGRIQSILSGKEYTWPEIQLNPE